jgi:NAD(P)-dependent dehydrogenase (short-subunit alcohol dehydrogenase family)
VTAIIDTALDRTLIGYSRVGYSLRRRHWPADPEPGALRGRTALVTGARAGIGRATVVGLARLGATVRMVVRTRGPGEEVRAAILEEVPGAELIVDECDVSSLASVRAYAGSIGDVDVLVHNAGVLPQRRETTPEGHELTLATHVLGPHLLTALLRPARVIWVSSGGMYTQRLRIDDLEYSHGDYRGATAYARTKRMQVALAQEWSERAAAMLVHSAHPGWVATPGIAKSLPRFASLTRAILRTPAQGADTLVWLAATDVGSGRFWHDRRPRPFHYLPFTRETAADRRALWDACCRITGADSRSAAPAPGSRPPA